MGSGVAKLWPGRATFVAAVPTLASPMGVMQPFFSHLVAATLS